MSTQNKMSKAKILALVISVAIHAALIYYIGKAALDYALPQGEVTSYEMDFSKGSQVDTTEVDVIEAAPEIKPIAKDTPKPSEPVKEVVTKPEVPPKTLPTKEETPIEDKQGEMPVATEVPENLNQDPIPEPEPLPIKEEAPAVTTEELIPIEKAMEQQNAEAAAQTATQENLPPANGSNATTDQAFGTATGIQSDTALVPFGTNRPITYPTIARFRKLEGVTVVHYKVSATGEVLDVQVFQSSGHASLDNQAIDTIKGWKFKPTGREGVYERPVRYQLTGDAKEAPSKLRRLNK